MTFFYDEWKKEFYQKWDGFVPSKVFREAVDQIVPLTLKYPSDYIISDATTMTTLAPKENEYAAQYMEALFANGVKFMAFLLSEKTLSHMAFNRFTKINKSAMNVEYFSKIEEARAWVNANRF